MILYAVRFVWIAAHILCLIEIACTRSRYGWWMAYVGASTMLAVCYWPELLPGWEHDFAPALIAVLLLRVTAILEALHHQTCDFPWWSRMMLGSFSFAACVVICIALVRDGHWAGLLVEYRRYLQIWALFTMVPIELLMLSVGWWRSRTQDWHVAALFAMALNHGVVSIIDLTNHPKGSDWQHLNIVSTAVDAAVLLSWAFAHRSGQSER